MPKFLFLLLTLLLSACQTTTAPKKSHLILDWFPNPNHIPLYVGVKKGFFDEAGIPLTIIKANDVTNGLGHLISGEADFAISYMHSYIKAKHEGAPVTLIGKIIETPLDGLLFHQDGTIKSPKDLSEKKLGYAVNSTTKQLTHLLDANNIFPSSCQNCSFDLLGMFLSKEVDMVYGAYETIEGTQAEHLGFSIGHFSLDQLGFPPYHELVVISLKENKNFTNALEKSIIFCKKHPEEAFAIYQKCHPEKSKETLQWERVAWNKSLNKLPEDQIIDSIMVKKLENYLNKET